MEIKKCFSFQISHKPETIDDIEAAGVLYAGLTAWSGLYISGHIGGVLGALTSQGKLIFNSLL